MCSDYQLSANSCVTKVKKGTVVPEMPWWHSIGKEPCDVSSSVGSVGYWLKASTLDMA
jgi:hypothetical protein